MTTSKQGHAKSRLENELNVLTTKVEVLHFKNLQALVYIILDRLNAWWMSAHLRQDYSWVVTCWTKSIWFFWSYHTLN